MSSSAIQNLEKLIIDLETRLAFQDDFVLELNDIVIEQQRQLDELRIEVKSLIGYLRNELPSLIATQSEETPPPHY